VKFGSRRPLPPPDPDLIRSLAKLLDETGLTEIDYAVGDQRVRVARRPEPAVVASAPAVAPGPPAEAAKLAPAPGTNGAHAPGANGANGADPPGTLKAPLVGIAYLGAEPGTPPYVKVGDTVTEGQTLLIIEAMKVMNQIRAPRAGRVARVFVADAEPVEYGSALMLIE
jgi:acetyl-CoA carboxylase biotin carboxyl carrier protein